jgi:cell wall assembly regulator SMI1
VKDILKKISHIAVDQKVRGLSEGHVLSCWLGTFPAHSDDIKMAEQKLGVKLPEDYKEFLLTTNGFFTPCDSTEPTFEKVSDITYLKDVDPFLLEIWNEGVLENIGRQLNRAIVVAGLNDEQYFFLIPPVDEANNEWQYWKFANWIPGEEPYENLQTYFESVLDLMEDPS